MTIVPEKGQGLETSKQKAVRLRTEGYSLRVIVEEVKAPKSTVYGWIRHIKPVVLIETDVSKGCRQKAGQTNKARHAKKREAWREEGRAMARLGSPLHIMGCSLYWAEGTKSTNTVKFSNSDLAMNRLFINFLNGPMNVDKRKIKARVFCYDDVHSVEQIQTYWELGLGLASSQFNSPIVNPYPQAGVRPSQKKRLGKLPYGTCHLSVHDVRLIHRIYGALEIYGNVFYHSQLPMMVHAA